MRSVHCLNVNPGDCTVIRHGSGRVTVIDICDGNLQTKVQKGAAVFEAANPLGNFGMCKKPTNPMDYLASLDIDAVWRFILTHPDMDHMDGLNRLFNEIQVNNFWDSGCRRAKPDFSGSNYLEVDWDRYVKILDGKQNSVTLLQKLAGASFYAANREQDGKKGGDGLTILAPGENLIDDANDGEDINDGSYVILYRSGEGRVIIAGDAHDATWDYVLENYASDVENASFLLAPHHGRHSDRSYDFLDHIKPKLTLFGCVPHQHLNYHAWSNRDLPYLTSNQVGNLVLEVGSEGLDIFIQNLSFAEKRGWDGSTKNAQGYAYLWTIEETKE